jgi:uncharacterized damage-inducible protein DinB
MTIAELLVPEFDREMANTRTLLTRLPEDRFSWTPHRKSWTMGNLATHLANIPTWATRVLSGDSFDVAAPGAAPHRTVPLATRAELLDAFDRNVAAARNAIAQATDEQLLKPWSLLSGGKAIFTLPRASVLRNMVFNHSIHHRAQLSLYLRLNDLPMPGFYGPTADEARSA